MKKFLLVFLTVIALFEGDSLIHAAEAVRSSEEQNALNAAFIDAATVGRLNTTNENGIDQLGIEELYNQGASINAQDENGNTALIIAALNGNECMVAFLLEKGADVNLWNYNRDTPLMLANTKNIAWALLAQDNIFFDIKNKNGDTALLIFLDRGFYDLAGNLVRRGADVNAQGLMRGETPLMVVVEQGNLVLVQFLVKHGANIEARDRYGNTSLMLAALEGGQNHVHILKFLLDKGASIDAFNADGQTALMLAAQSGKEENLKLLLARGAKINLQDKKGQTALMLAIDEGQLKSVVHLLSYQPDQSLTDKTGRTALEIALSNQHDAQALRRQLLVKESALSSAVGELAGSGLNANECAQERELLEQKSEKNIAAIKQAADSIKRANQMVQLLSAIAPESAEQEGEPRATKRQKLTAEPPIKSEAVAAEEAKENNDPQPAMVGKHEQGQPAAPKVVEREVLRELKTEGKSL